MSDEEYQLTRRLFLQQSAMASAVTAGFYSIAMKTDALAQDVDALRVPLRGDNPSPYMYFDGPE
jgi:hypothetical protein